MALLSWLKRPPVWWFWVEEVRIIHGYTVCACTAECGKRFLEKCGEDTIMIRISDYFNKTKRIVEDSIRHCRNFHFQQGFSLIQDFETRFSTVYLVENFLNVHDIFLREHKCCIKLQYSRSHRCAIPFLTILLLFQHWKLSSMRSNRFTTEFSNFKSATNQQSTRFFLRHNIAFTNCKKLN